MKSKFLLIATTLVLLSMNVCMASNEQKIVSTMRNKAQEIISNLSKKQQGHALFSFQSDLKRKWRYFPSPKSTLIFPDHTGLNFQELSSEQQVQVLELVYTALNPSGKELVQVARAEDSDPKIKRKEMERMFFKYGKENYFISFFGKPTDKKWMWRFEGHHVSVNINIEDNNIVSAAPFFLGVNPAEYVLEGRQLQLHESLTNGLQTLLSKLNDTQIKMAGQSLKKFPKDLLFTPSLLGKDQTPKGALPSGLKVSQLKPEAQELILNLIKQYLGNLTDEARDTIMNKVIENGLGNIEFVFTGDLQGLYYWRLQGPSFVFEFGCADGQANHYHVSWMDLK